MTGKHLRWSTWRPQSYTASVYLCNFAGVVLDWVGECLTEQDHIWVGIDISGHMLGWLLSYILLLNLWPFFDDWCWGTWHHPCFNIVQLIVAVVGVAVEREVDGDLVLGDMGAWHAIQDQAVLMVSIRVGSGPLYFQILGKWVPSDRTNFIKKGGQAKEIFWTFTHRCCVFASAFQHFSGYAMLTNSGHNPPKRLFKFFTTLYAVMVSEY